MDKMLEGRIAIITGSGRGIGQAAAVLFAKEGAKVVVSDIDPEPAEETVQKIKDLGGEAVAFIGDATAPEFAEGIVKKALDTWGGLHIIVNNAGYIWDSMIHKMADKQWEAMLNIHLTTPFRIIRAAAPYIREAADKEKQDGAIVSRKIVNVISTAGTDGNAGQANYSSAKSGCVGLTKTMAKEWGRYNVQSNAVAFGWVETRLTGPKEKIDKIVVAGNEVSVGVPEAQQKMARMMIPMGRPGTTDEAAGVILFFASPLSNYVSGQVLPMTGGM